MTALALLLMAADPADPAALARRMLPVYVADARAYSIAAAAAPDIPLAFRPEPVFEWSNPTRNGGQQGVVFVWLRDGRPAAAGCVFSSPEADPRFPDARRVEHELHALDPDRLAVARDAPNRWEPREGVARREVPAAAAPAATAAARRPQMGRLAAGFAGHTFDPARKARYELRVLPTPLYRYPQADDGVTDGGLFALVSEAGTDPEALLVVEARAGRWEYAVGRFTDCDVRVTYKGPDGAAGEVFASVPGADNPYPHNPPHTYRTYQDKIVAADGRVLARLRQNPNGSHAVLAGK